MRNERLLILRMIEEGKITSAEGLALLEALEEEGPWPEGSGPEVEAAAQESLGTDPGAGRGSDEPVAKGAGAAGVEAAGPETEERGREAAGSETEERGGEAAGPEAGGQDEEPGRERRSGPGEESRSWWDEPSGGGHRKDEDEGGAVFRLGFDPSRMGEQVMRAVDQLGERLQDVFETSSSWLNDWLGKSYEFPSSEFGDVTPGELLHVEVRLPNGWVTVEPSPDDRYHAEWVVHVRGADRERAAERARQGVSLERERGRLVLRGADGWWNFMGRVDVILRLPSQGRYHLEFSLANASLRLEEIRAERLQARLANGTTTVERVELGDFDLKAANGRIRMNGCRARRGRLGTANGRVEFVGAARRLRLSTSNGRVLARLSALSAEQAAGLPTDGNREDGSEGEGILAETVNGEVRLQVDDELAARALVQLRSVHGVLEVDLPNLNVWHRERATGRNRLEAAGPQAGSDPFSIEGRSQSGSVRVERWGAGEPWE